MEREAGTPNDDAVEPLAGSGTPPGPRLGGLGPERGALIARIVVGLAVVIAAGYFIVTGNPGRNANEATRLDPLSGAQLTSPSVTQAQIDSLAISPDTIQPFTAEEARTWNKALPVSTEPVRPAPRFFAPADDPAAYRRAVDCLAAAIYYEAGQETIGGKMAVAQVVLNRVRHPVFPKSVCGVVFEGSQRKTGCQFSFTCDGAMARLPTAGAWAGAVSVAEAALNGFVAAEVGPATHYHADYVAPYWAPRLTKLATVGVHVFYRFPGAWSETSALRGRYLGEEPVIAKMAALTAPEVEVLAPTIPELGVLSPLSISDGGGLQIPPIVPEIRAQPNPEPELAVREEDTVAEVASETEKPPIVANPLTTGVTAPRRSRIARPGEW